jgi:hypothetical protein
MQFNREKRARSHSTISHLGEDTREHKRRASPYQTSRTKPLKGTRHELKVLQKPRTYAGLEFMPLPLIEKFWSGERTLQAFLVALDCKTSPRTRQAIEQDSLRVFTALVLVEWESSKRFRQVFQAAFPEEGPHLWTDENLISGPGLEGMKTLGLTDDELTELQSNADLVSVPILQLHHGSKRYAKRVRLPITSKDEVGKGAYGTVYKIQIAEGCLRVENSNGDTSPNKVCSTMLTLIFL